jgi:hypothetical protein
MLVAIAFVLFLIFPVLFLIFLAVLDVGAELGKLRRGDKS